MKHFLPATLTAAAVSFAFTACDGEKTEEAKTKTVEAAKATGEVVKDTTGKVLDKTGDLLQKAGDKLKGAKEKLSPTVESAKEKAGATVEKIKSSPAMEKFKGGLQNFSTLMTNLKGQAGDDMAKAKQMANDLMAKLGTVSTEGVPDDVKTAFEGYRSVMSRVLKFTINIPADQAAREKYVSDNANELHQLEKDAQTAGKALREAAAKHGLTNLDLGETEE